MPSVLDFPVGSYVQVDCRLGMRDEPGAETKPEHIGTVKGITVNSFGEPVLLVHMITRKYHGGLDMEGLGWRPLAGDHSRTFWERTGPMHPANMRMLHPHAMLRP